MNNHVKHNGNIYTYHVGAHNIRIQSPDGKSETVNKNLVKGKSKPSFLKKIFRQGKRNFDITHEDMVKYIKENY